MDLDDIIRKSYEQEHANLSQLPNRQQETLDYILNHAQVRTKSPLAKVIKKLNRFVTSMSIMDAVGVLAFVIILFIIPSLIGKNQLNYDADLAKNPPQQTNTQKPTNEGIKDSQKVYEIVQIKFDDITKITFLNGRTGESATVEDEGRVKEFMELVDSYKVMQMQGNPEVKPGTAYSAGFYNGDKEAFNLQFISLEPQSNLGINGVQYRVTKTNLTIEKIEEFLKKTNNNEAKGQNINFLYLSPELNDIYNKYSKDKNDNLLKGLEPQDICRLYFFAESKKDYDTVYSLYLKDEVYQIPTKDEFLKDVDDEVNIENTAKLQKVLKEKVYDVKVEYHEANALVMIYIDDKEFWGNDYIWFNTLKSKTGIWKVQFMPMQ